MITFQLLVCSARHGCEVGGQIPKFYHRSVLGLEVCGTVAPFSEGPTLQHIFIVYHRNFRCCQALCSPYGQNTQFRKPLSVDSHSRPPAPANGMLDTLTASLIHTRSDCEAQPGCGALLSHAVTARVHADCHLLWSWHWPGKWVIGRACLGAGVSVKRA